MLKAHIKINQILKYYCERESCIIVIEKNSLFTHFHYIYIYIKKIDDNIDKKKS